MRRDTQSFGGSRARDAALRIGTGVMRLRLRAARVGDCCIVVGVTKKAGRKTKRTGRTKRSGRTTRIFGRPPGEVLSRGRADGLGRVFAGRALLPLLKVFFLSPSRDFYQRELAVTLGERLFVIQTALKRLIEAGLIEFRARGNRTYYRANQSHPAFPDLKALVLKTVGLGESLRAHLRGLEGRIKVAFVYGSVARGEEGAASDVDLMFVGDISGRELASVLAPARKSLNREINPTTYAPDELRRKVREGSPFIREVLAGPKMFLLGDERALARLSRRRLS